MYTDERLGRHLIRLLDLVIEQNWLFNDASIISIIESLIEPTKICIISGDFNLNFLTDANNVIVTALQRLKFTQVIDQPTHTQGGIIDHLYIRQPHIYRKVEIISDLVAAFYSDHIGIQITLLKNENEFRHIENSVPDHLIDQAVNEENSKHQSKKRKNENDSAKAKRH